MNNVTGNLLSLLCSAWRAVLKIFVRLFRIKQVKASSLAGAIYKEEKWKNGTKRILDNLRKKLFEETDYK